MQEFNAENWEKAKGSITLPLTEKSRVTLWISCPKTVKVFGVCQGEKVLLKTGTDFFFKGTLTDFSALTLQGEGQAEFGYSFRHQALQLGEYNSGEKAPVVDLPAPSNLIQQMHRIAKEQAAFARYPVLEPDDGTHPFMRRYELDDDDALEFEEELFERLSKEQAKTAAETPAEPPPPPAPPPTPTPAPPPAE